MKVNNRIEFIEFTDKTLLTFTDNDANYKVSHIPDDDSTPPIVLDLNHNNTTSTNLENSTAYFDYDGDGDREHTAWAEKDDALLAVDLNNDGVINDGSELFGNFTKLPDGTLAADGYAALAQYDTNADKIIDSKDTAFGKLLLWKDTNQNGKSEAGELSSIQLSGVTAIYLYREDGTTFEELTENGNIITNQTVYKTEDTSDGTLRDVWFKFDSNNTITDNDTLKASISGETLSGAEGDDIYLYAIGDGKITIDDAGDGADKIKLSSGISLEQILVKWDKNSDNLIIGVREHVEDDTPLKELSDQILIKDWFKDSGLIETIEFADGTTLDRASMYNLIVTKRDNEEITARVLDSGTELVGGDFNDVLYGSSGDELLKGYSGNDFLKGKKGDDRLIGGAGDDSLEGGKDDDTMIGEGGDDYYIYNRGDGRDVIIDSLGDDTLMFGDDIMQRDLLIEFNGDDLMIGLKEGDKSMSELSDTITIQNYTEQSFKVESIEFSDGTVSDISKLIEINSNHAPEVINHEENFILEDTARKSGIVFAIDPDGDSLSYSIQETTSHGTINIDENGIWNYKAEENYVGEDFAIIMIDDGNGKSTTTTLHFEMKASAPVIDDALFALQEDTISTGTLALTGNTIGVTYEVINAPENGTFNLNENGEYSYTPTANYNGQENIMIKVTNQYGISDTATLIFDVEAVNDVPTIVESDTEFELTNIESTSGKVEASDIDGDSVTYSAAVSENAPFSIDEQGNWNYTPQVGFVGEDSVIISIDDGNGGIITETLNFNVLAASPVIEDINLALEEDTNLEGQLAITGNTAGLTYTVITPSENAVLSIDEHGNYTYTPNANYNGTDSITIEVTNQYGQSDTAILTFAIEAVNDAPVAQEDSANIAENATLIISAEDILANDSDVDVDDKLSLLSISAPEHKGVATLDANGNLSFIAGTDFDHLAEGVSEEVEISYVIEDSAGATATSTIKVTVTGTNDIPIAQVDTVTLDEDNTIMIDVLANDSDVDDGDVLTIKEISNQPNHGVVTLNENGTLNYRPTENYFGTDSFTYTVVDSQGAEVTSEVTVTVNGINDAPTLAQTVESITLIDSIKTSGHITASDIEDDTLTYHVSTTPTHGKLIVDDTGAWTYNVNSTYAGNDSAIITIDDGHGGTVTKTLNFTIDNDPINGNNEKNELNGTNGIDIINGLDSNDTIYADNGNDIIVGGKGDDNLFGEKGDDTYIFNLGDGNDWIADFDKTLGNHDKIVLGEGITREDLEIQRDGSDLIIIVNDNDSITINDWYERYDMFKIEELVFSDGSSMTYQELEGVATIEGDDGKDTLKGSNENDNIYGLGGNDKLYGYNGDDKLFGGSGKDSIYADNGNDIIVGGKGDDNLFGDKGDDTYIFNLGDGNDWIEDFDKTLGNHDKIVLGEGITREDLEIQRDGSDLIIIVNDNDSITVNDWYESYDRFKIEEIQFSDGSSMSYHEIEDNSSIRGNDGKDRLKGSNAKDTIFGLGGNDKLYGYNGDDKLFGGSGNDIIYADHGNDEITGGIGRDYLSGGKGDDTYYFSLGDGVDKIKDYDRNQDNHDKIILGKGIGKDDVTFMMDKKNLIISYSESDSINVLRQSDERFKIEEVVLADGSYITSSDIDKMIQSINAYATEHDIEIDSVSDIKKSQEMMNIVSSSWHN